jgi:cobalt-zinc-cadmium efflux system membrane fusion protein
MKKSFWPSSAVLLVCLVAGASAGCSRKSRANAEGSPGPAKVEEVGDVNLVTVAHPEQFPLVEVEARKLADELHVNGVVTPDVNRSVPVLSLSGGRVVEIRARLGDDVKRGQILLLISSPDLGSAFSDYQKFAADEILARRQLERSQLLYSKGAIAEKDFEAAQDAEDKAGEASGNEAGGLDTGEDGPGQQERDHFADQPADGFHTRASTRPIAAAL